MSDKMIDFSCQKFSIEEIIKCSLGLTKAELQIYIFLKQNNETELTTEELAKKTKLNLSTVQRCVKRI